MEEEDSFSRLDDKSISKRQKQLMKTKVSNVWEYFRVLKNERFECNLCGTEFSSKSSTSTLKRHLLKKHPDINNNF